MSIITSGNPVHPHMMVPNEGACTVMSEQNTDNLQDMSAHAQVLDKQNPKRVGGNISDSVLNSSETLLFTEVTAKVPLSLMNKLDIADQLPFLVKLAKDVNVSIVVGVEEEIETELKVIIFWVLYIAVNQYLELMLMFPVEKASNSLPIKSDLFTLFDRFIGYY